MADSINEPLGVIEVQPGEGVETWAVKNDPDSDIVAEYKSDSFIISDSVSVASPIPIFLTENDYWVDAAGNVQDVLRLNLRGIIPPVPGPMGFWTNDHDLTEYETAFDVAGPNIFVCMAFHYEGDIDFTVTHEGEELEIVSISLNDDAGIGCLIAIGVNMTIETGTLKFEATGGTFGGVFGEANELDYVPSIAWVDDAIGDDQNDTLGGSEVGDVIAVGVALGNVANGVQFTNLDVLTFGRPISGDPIPVTPPAVIGGGWTEAGGVYSHDESGGYTRSNEFIFDDPVEGPIWVDVGVNVGVGAGYRQYITGPTDERYAGTIRRGDNQNFTNGIGLAGQMYESGSISANGVVDAWRVRWLKDPIIAGSTINRKNGQSAANMRSSYGQPWAICAVCLVDNWTPANLFADGSIGYWAGGFDPNAGRMFTTTAGTTAITTFGQAVGRADRLAGTIQSATQTTEANKPISARWPMSGRRNMLRFTEDLSNAVWVKSMVSVTSEADEFWRVARTGGSSTSLIQNLGSVANDVEFTATIELRAAGNTTCAIGLYRGNFDASRTTAEVISGPGAVTNSGYIMVSGLSTTATTKIRITRTTNSADPATAMSLYVYPADTGSTLGSTMVRYPQVEVGAVGTPYQKVTTEYDVTESGQPTIYHITDDDVNDSLNLTVAAGTYTIGYVNGYGDIVWVDGAVNPSPEDILRTKYLRDYIIIGKALSSTDKLNVENWWKGQDMSNDEIGLFRMGSGRFDDYLIEDE